MKWRTEVKVSENPGYISYKDSILSIGSCFSDEIGRKLSDGGFNISVNPFGVIFNPVSILQLVQNALEGNLREELIFERDMKWFHFGYHSKINGVSKEDLISNINSAQYAAQRKLLEGDHLFITLGSAWVYRLQQQNAVVANCHKMPSPLFVKELIELEKLKVFSDELFKKLFEQNPKIKVLVTVSPVRHSKDGLHENNLSKAVLHLYAKYLTDQFTNIHYFPAYELVVDELRDYRFFKEDLVHPSQQAVDFVFDKFKYSHFNEGTLKRFELMERLKRAQLHHFMNATIEEVTKHEQHIQQLKEQLEKMDK
ncbi:MAG: GSCFA domain-containing protein [Crocinitomicaceae bacterium]|nr:GSCFA domain-containing protein [Crocinitomicaceae bacterium]